MEGTNLPTKQSGFVSDGIAMDGRPPVFLILSGLCSSNNCLATFVRNSINCTFLLLLFTLYNTNALYKHINKMKKEFAIPFACFSCAFSQANLHVCFIHSPHVFSIANHTLWLTYKLTCCIVLFTSVHYSWCIYCREHAYISFIAPF